MRAPEFNPHEVVSSGREVLRFVADEGETPESAPRGASGLEPVPGWQARAAVQPEAAPRERSDPSFLLTDDGGSRFTPEATIGVDDRVRIHETTAFPWRTICALRITTRKGEHFSGTGWLVSARTVITAGHCLYLPTLGGWVDRVEVVPGQNANDRPYSTASSNDFRCVRGWTEDGEREYDYGAIILPKGQGFAELGHLGYAVYDEARLVGAYLNIAGYPIDKPQGTLWWAARAAKQVRRGKLSYELDTAAGQSGAPVWRVDTEGRRLVVGIHTNGNERGNSATRITDEVFANLQRWAAEGVE